MQGRWAVRAGAHRAGALLQESADSVLRRSAAASPTYRRYKANHYDVATGEEFWVSGPKTDGKDRLYGERIPVYVDKDVRVECWSQLRGLPHRAQEADSSR